MLLHAQNAIATSGAWHSRKGRCRVVAAAEEKGTKTGDRVMSPLQFFAGRHVRSMAIVGTVA